MFMFFTYCNLDLGHAQYIGIVTLTEYLVEMLFVYLANCSGLRERGYYCLLNCKLYEQLQ